MNESAVHLAEFYGKFKAYLGFRPYGLFERPEALNADKAGGYLAEFI